MISSCCIAAVLWWAGSVGVANVADDELTQDRGWSAGTIAEQLDGDATLVPFGKGSIFVPAMTNPLDEPPVAVWREGKKVAEGTTGKRILLFPGRYTVRMGSGTVEQRFETQAEVVEMHTSVVPVTWAGLAIHVVDEQLNSLRGSYELIRVDGREYLGVGFGSDEEAGEPVTTWVLRPGLYKIVRVGETYRARRDYVTVRLIPGHLTHFQLVLDEDTGEFRGGGEVPLEDLFTAQNGTTVGNFVLGGDLTFNSRENVLGTENGNSWAFRTFMDSKLSAELFDNPFLGRLQVEEGQTKSPRLPWQKTQDRAELDLLYVYRLMPWLGPYLRAGAETNLLRGTERFNELRDVEVQNSDGTLRRVATQLEEVRLSSPVGHTNIKEGAGLHVRLFKAVFGETNVRLGVGARHRLVRNLVEKISAAGADPIVYRRVDPTNQVGVEATLVAVMRLTRWVLGNVELDTLIPFADASDVILEIEGTLTLKLTRFVSINYVIRHLRDPTLAVGHRDPLEQDILLRFSFELF